jgi:hypothetical protein
MFRLTKNTEHLATALNVSLIVLSKVSRHSNAVLDWTIFLTFVLIFSMRLVSSV